MKAYTIVLLLLFVQAGVLAQGIQFDEGSWAEIKAKAKAAKK